MYSRKRNSLGDNNNNNNNIIAIIILPYGGMPEDAEVHQSSKR